MKTIADVCDSYTQKHGRLNATPRALARCIRAEFPNMSQSGSFREAKAFLKKGTIRTSRDLDNLPPSFVNFVDELADKFVIEMP